jgi:hypothetical protein
MTEVLPRFIRDLQLPSAYGHAVASVELRQTHISYVLLAGEYAYKIKKPLDLGFLDYSTLDRRRRMCEEEVRLNRRLCDGVYLGVVPITRREDGVHCVGGPGTPVEYAVQMRRVPEDYTMPYLLSSDRLSGEQLSALAERVAAFHRDAPDGDRIASFGRVAAVQANWDENFAQTAAFVGRTLDAADLQAVRVYVSRFLDQQAALIEERADAGRVREGHGDLRSDSVVFAPDGSVCVMDCIEFSDRLRCGDIAADAAFLAMDLEFRGHRRIADEFLSMYMEQLGGDETLPMMLNFYGAYRAFIRGKVESMQSDESEVPATQRSEAMRRAQLYFSLARSYAERSLPPFVVAMTGLSGTGKSFLARALAARAGAVLLSTDLVRREHARGESLGPAPYDAGAYTNEQRQAAYAEMFARARRHLALGRSVVLDATFLTRLLRASGRELARDFNVAFRMVAVETPEGVVRERLMKRGADTTSDARWSTYLAQRDRAEPLDEDEAREALTLDAKRPLDSLVNEAFQALQAATN